jgi:hypothetical protein
MILLTMARQFLLQANERFYLEFPIWTCRLRIVCLFCSEHNEFATRVGSRQDLDVRPAKSQETVLVEAANAAAKAKGTYLRDIFHRLKARRGYKRATVTVAHKILVAIYHTFSHQIGYNEFGDLYLDKLNKHRVTGNWSVAWSI